jgi:ketosteroid isomerase-like protein
MILNEDRMRAQIERFNRAFSQGAVDALLAELSPDVDYGPATTTAEGRALHGHDEVRRYFAQLHDAFEQVSVEPERFEELADGIVLTVGRWRARGRASGVAIDSTWAVASQLLPDHRVVWVRAFTDERSAREAAMRRAADLGRAVSDS